jgi:hypothetical protein
MYLQHIYKNNRAGVDINANINSERFENQRELNEKARW